MRSYGFAGSNPARTILVLFRLFFFARVAKWSNAPDSSSGPYWYPGSSPGPRLIVGSFYCLQQSFQTLNDIGNVTQLEECRTSNPEVAGSTPVIPFARVAKWQGIGLQT